MAGEAGVLALEDIGAEGRGQGINAGEGVEVGLCLGHCDSLVWGRARVRRGWKPLGARVVGNAVGDQQMCAGRTMVMDFSMRSEKFGGKRLREGWRRVGGGASLVAGVRLSEAYAKKDYLWRGCSWLVLC